MNYIDIIIAIPLVWAIYKGFTKGFIISVASLLALIVGIYGALKFSHHTSYFLIDRFHFSDKYLPIISFAITFILIVIAIHLLAKLLDTLVKAVALGFVNRIFGVVFNVVKMAFILSVIIVIIDGFDKKTHVIPDDLKEGSLLYEPLSLIAPAIFPYLSFERSDDSPGKSLFDI